MSKLKKYVGMKGKQEKKLPYRSILFVVIVIAIFGSAIYLIMSKSAALEPVDKDAIKMTISMAGFEPNTIRAKAGQPVTINLINLIILTILMAAEFIISFFREAWRA